MKIKSVIILLSVGLMLSVFGCNNDPKPISYGVDACDFCRMTIVDKQHAAQLVTVKGKNYKYDAIECMINDINKWKRPPVETHLVADYSNPGSMTDAFTSSYLISEKIPSPMGANLSAFSNEINRDEMHSAAGGEKLNWEQLTLRLNRKTSHIHHH